MTKLVNDYVMHRENVALQTVASRLLYDLLPGLDTSVIFNETEGLVEWMLTKAEHANEPLRSYSTGLLGAAMEIQSLAEKYKDQSMRLNAILLKRLKELAIGLDTPDHPDGDHSSISHKSSDSHPHHPHQHNHSNHQQQHAPVNRSKGSGDDAHVFERPFAAFTPNSNNVSAGKRSHSPDQTSNGTPDGHSFTIPSPVSKKRRISSPNSPAGSLHTESNSSWADLEPLIVGSFSLHPLTPEMQQRFILQCLSPMGNYQELLPHVFGEDTMGVILQLIDLNRNQDIRLSFEALKYLSSLFCHKKFALDFLERGGLQQMLQVYRPSVAATGVALCLYCLVDIADATEKICQMHKPILTELVSYSLWLLERSHETSKSNATMFFASSFAFRIILEIFDAQDGLRKLLNAMFILNLFEDSDPETTHEQDVMMGKRQLARQTCVALKKYFEAHLFFESERVRRLTSTSSSSQGSSSNPGKVARFKPEDVSNQLESLLELNQGRISWKPVNDLIELGGVKQIMTLIAIAPTWSFPGKPDPIKSSLDVLVVASVVPRMQLKLKDRVENVDGEEVAAMKVILHFLETVELSGNEATITFRNRDPQGATYATLALMIIINCVCESAGPSGSSSKNISASARKKSHFRHNQSQMWKCVLECDGVGVLLNLLKITGPMNEAYSIRCLACRALCGLSNCEEIRQILAKLPMFTCGTLQSLMKKPVLQYNESDFDKFVRYGRELMHRVTGAPIEMNIDTSPESLNRAEVVSQTQITFNEEQLLQLMHDYLVRKGFSDIAAGLYEQANLSSAASKITHRPFPATTPNSKAVAAARNAAASFSCPTTPSAASVHAIAVSLFRPSSQSSITSTPTAGITNQIASSSQSSNQSSSQGSLLSSSPIPGSGYRRPLTLRVRGITTTEKPGGRHQSPFPRKHSLSAGKTVTLESIVTEYLRNQHSKCSNPIVTCPPFDILTPHKCPEPTKRNQAPGNMAMRISRKEILPKYGGPFGRKFDRKFVYSKFCPVKTFKEAEGAQSFTSCAFSYPSEQRNYGDGELITPPYLFVGTSSGEMATFNLDTGLLVSTYTCHDTDITYIEPSRDGKSIITCSIWRSPVSALWTFTDIFELKMPFEEDFHVEYGKMYQDKAIGTKNSAANLYDLNTTVKIATFHDESASKKYYKNQATFNYTDELVLNDGLLWDVRSKNIVHKFNKFDNNNTINGVFHPNGWEIIANSYIVSLVLFAGSRSISCQCIHPHSGT